MSKVLVDYHMHTPLCGHAVGDPAEYARVAIANGLSEIGFSDHAPMIHQRMQGITMAMEELPYYYKMIETVRAQYKNELNIKIGIEADFIPGYEEKSRVMLADYPYDYVIGSVHFIKDWGFDDPDQRDKWDDSDVDTVYRDYYDLLRQSARSGLFDIMAHVDLVKKFGHRSSIEMDDEVQKTAKVFKETGVAIEINTSGARKLVEEMYPSLWNLKIYARHGIPLTFGSDAHEPADVGRDFDAALALAIEAGFSEHVLFKSRKIEKVITF